LGACRELPSGNCAASPEASNNCGETRECVSGLSLSLNELQGLPLGLESEDGIQKCHNWESPSTQVPEPQSAEREIDGKRYPLRHTQVPVIISTASLLLLLRPRTLVPRTPPPTRPCMSGPLKCSHSSSIPCIPRGGKTGMKQSR
jgi:hypothetical protein